MTAADGNVALTSFGNPGACDYFSCLYCSRARDRRVSLAVTVDD